MCCFCFLEHTTNIVVDDKIKSFTKILTGFSKSYVKSQINFVSILVGAGILYFYLAAL